MKVDVEKQTANLESANTIMAAIWIDGASDGGLRCQNKIDWPWGYFTEFLFFFTGDRVLF